MRMILVLLCRLLNLYSWVIMVHCVLSFVPQLDHPVIRIIHGVCEPVLRPIRDILMRYFPMRMFDWSPMVVFLLINVLQTILMRLM